jgi:hypothetical protein
MQKIYNEVFEYDIPLSVLDINARKVLKYIRSGNAELDEFSYSFLEDFLESAGKSSEIKGGFTYIPPGFIKISGNYLKIADTEFLSEKIITSRLRKADSAAIFAVTAGKWFEEESKKYISDGDIFSGFLIDSTASEIAEAAAEWIEKRVGEFAGARSVKTTSRYSPGYCGWSVGEQHKLFSFFPRDFCGIKLTLNALMVPVKSISGIIGIGENVKKEEYGCEICDDENCFRRKL